MAELGYSGSRELSTKADIVRKWQYGGTKVSHAEVDGGGVRSNSG